MDCEECESGYVLDSTSTRCVAAVGQASSSITIIISIAIVAIVLLFTGALAFKLRQRKMDEQAEK
jgi:signal transduction histidine kinase